MRCFRLLLLAAALAAAAPAAAQNATDGSIYSRFGLGELRTIGSSQLDGMGGGGVALPSHAYTNHANPAALADQILTRVSAGLLYQGLVATDASDATSRLTEGSLGAVQFSFPILQRRLGLGISFEPYSRVSYQVQSEGLLLDTAADTALYRINYEGSGGLQQVRVGAGYQVAPRLAVGLGADFLFGIIDNTRQTSFFTSGFRRTTLTTSTRLRGVTATAGALATFPAVLGEQDYLSLGLTFTLPTNLAVTRVETLGESLDRDTLGVAREGDLSLPFGVAGGVVYRPDLRWTLVADARYEPWSSFDSDLGVPGFTPGGESTFRDRVRASVGGEFYPAGRDLTAPFLARTAYRIGAYYDRAYVAPIDDLNLSTLALTTGISIPTTFSGTRLDVNVALGTRGTTDRGLVRDRFYRIAASLNFGERWFEQRKLR